jgi:hypothetical protein
MVSTLVVVTALGLTGCSSDGDDGGSAGSSTGKDSGKDRGGQAAEVARPDGPAAEIAGPLEGGKGLFLGVGRPGPDLADAGYVESEYRVAGTATSYTSAGELPTDGTYELEPSETADYATRIVVRRPAEADAFNGTVVVEWMNVSGGVDAAPDYTYLSDEIVRGGYAWVGVSAQAIGIEGGPVAVVAPGAAERGAGKGLKGIDPERYGDLAHPGDAFAYDIYTQVVRALRSPGEVSPLDGLDIGQVLAVGESQSAFALTTYANGVQPLARQIDGFLVHSRGGAGAPLGDPGSGVAMAETIGGKPTTIRTDLDVPVLIVQTETDLLSILNYLPARQDDTDRIRLWEIAGTAHADTYQVGEMASELGCTQPINDGQQHIVLKAALRSLHTWVEDGEAPPEAERLEVDESGETPVFVRDELGNAKGGIRNPAVDAPVSTLTGEAPEGSSIICLLFGSSVPLADDRLAALYPTVADYTDAYEQATDAMIEAGFALEDDRQTILDEADPSGLAG